MRRVSKKRAKQNAEYLLLRADFLARYPKCRICGQPSTECHHMAHREGPWLTLVHFFFPICRPCHRSITDDPSRHPEAFHRVYYDYRTYVAMADDAGVDLTKPIWETLT